MSSPTAHEPVDPTVDIDVREVPTVVSVPAHPDDLAHQVIVVDGRFMHAECSCGWRTAGRRNRATVRAEARDHALLHAGASDQTV